MNTNLRGNLVDLSPSIPGESLAWLAQEEKRWKREKDPTLTFLDLVVDCADLIGTPSPPEWFERCEEYHYRKGFYHGVAEAAQLVSTLYAKLGFVRPKEISNIFYEWCTGDLRKWKSAADRETPLNNWSHPHLKIESWSKIRRAVFERDGFQCRECGCGDDLEAHHIEAVKDGGTPTLSNLTTLCKQCHRG